MASSISQNEPKAVFKKSVFRPWKPAVLDNAPSNEPSTELYAEFYARFEQQQNHFKKQLDAFQTQLAALLETRAKERFELQRVLTTLENTRITFGGFLDARTLLFPEDEAPINNTALMLEELKSREEEMMSIHHQLMLIDLQKDLRQAEKARYLSEESKKTSEETMQSALQEMEVALRELQQSEEQVCLLEHIKAKLEHTIVQLQADAVQAKQDHGAMLEAAQANFERKLLSSEESVFGLKQSLERQHQKCFELTHETTELHGKIDYLLNVKERMLQEKAASEEKLMNLNHYNKKMNVLLERERDLRKFFEEKSKVKFQHLQAMAHAVIPSL